MNAFVRAIKHCQFRMREPGYHALRAADRRELYRVFGDVMRSSKDYVYLAMTSRYPMVLDDAFRDQIFLSVQHNLGSMDFRALVHTDWGGALGFYDASFRIAKHRIGNFVIGDAGGFILATRPGGLFSLRQLFKDEDLRPRFLKAYAAGSHEG